MGSLSSGSPMHQSRWLAQATWPSVPGAGTTQSMSGCSTLTARRCTPTSRMASAATACCATSVLARRGRSASVEDALCDESFTILLGAAHDAHPCQLLPARGFGHCLLLVGTAGGRLLCPRRAAGDRRDSGQPAETAEEE